MSEFLETRFTRTNLPFYFTFVLVAFLCAGPTTFSSETDQSVKQELRVITYNIYNGNFWPRNNPLAREASKQGQFAKRLALELSLYRPDIITFSESPDESITREIARKLEMHHVRFPSGGNWPGTLLSKFEIVDSKNVPVAGGERPEDLFTRHWGQATVLLPDGSLLIVHSAHLFPRAANTEIRLKEISAMLHSMKEDMEAGHSMLLTGDLNHTPDTPEHGAWTESGWVDTFLAAGTGDGLTIPVGKPRRRIDYIMANGPLAARIIESRSLHEAAFRTHEADPNSFALSDHLPKLAVFDLSP